MRGDFAGSCRAAPGAASKPRRSCWHAPPPKVSRTPYFCSGCPHNTSTTRAGRQPRAWPASAATAWRCGWTATPRLITPHGRRGRRPGSARRRSPTTSTSSRTSATAPTTIPACWRSAQAVAAEVNITYKILYNDAVAMTGGQPVDGPLDRADDHPPGRGRRREAVVVVTDEPDKYPADYRLRARRHGPPPRRARRACSASCATSPGVTVLIYDQTCAAEKRRRRKRGNFPTGQARVHQRSGVRRLRRLLRQASTACRSSRSRPSSAASARSTSRPATRTSPA